MSPTPALDSIFTIPDSEPPASNLDLLKCICITVTATQQPQLCYLDDPRTLNWTAAQAFTRDHPALPLQFASAATLSLVLTVPEPLDNAVIRALERGPVFPIPILQGAPLDHESSMMVCGVRDEVRERLAGADHGRRSWLLVQVLGWFMALLALYVVAEWVWSLWERSPKARAVERKKG